MEAMGLQLVQLGESAWPDLEPRPGEFDLVWLKECLDLASRRKLGVVLCTPTAAAPRWLVESHPDALISPPSSGCGTQHWSPLSPELRGALSRVVTKLAETFGAHPAVVGWRVDAERGSPRDRSERAQAAFRDWLKAKYREIDALNAAWACDGQAARHERFEQIRLPDSNDSISPIQMAAREFWSRSLADFCRMQADILRPKIGERFLSARFDSFDPDLDPADLSEDFTTLAWDGRCESNETAEAGEAYRIGDPAAVGFMHRHAAGQGRAWGLTSMRSGQIDFNGSPVLPYPGAIRLRLWTAFAHGAEWALANRFERPRAGDDETQDGLTDSAGEAETPGGRQFAVAATEFRRLDPAKLAAAPKGPAPRSVGLLVDVSQNRLFESLTRRCEWNPTQWTLRWYAALARLGLPVEVIHPDRPWPADLSLLVVPGLQMVDEALVKRFDEFAMRGGHLALTCRTGRMDRTGTLWPGPVAAPLLPLIGASIEATDSPPRGVVGHVEFDGKRFGWRAWGELLYADSETRSVGKYADHFYAGATCITRRNHGEGSVAYCGVYADAPLVNAMTERLAERVGLPATALPPRVQLHRRGAYRILLNYQDTPVEAPAPAGSRFIVGAGRVEPAGVAVWEQ